MGRFIDETEFEKYIIHDGCEKGCGYIDERDLKYIQKVEAIPKADYENRLKADTIAMLTALQLDIEEKGMELCDSGWYLTYSDIVQQKIDELKRESEE